ncbi:hypothetical protein ACFPM0_05325 [Pseudonocardia sulfidoxydans]|uniref:hypothetical protein n=1 Tax=Pseudonocardia sulfidoxydans TaxID=54011 RepID=UPI00360E0E7C
MAPGGPAEAFGGPSRHGTGGRSRCEVIVVAAAPPLVPTVAELRISADRGAGGARFGLTVE